MYLKQAILFFIFTICFFLQKMTRVKINSSHHHSILWRTEKTRPPKKISTTQVICNHKFKSREITLDKSCLVKLEFTRFRWHHSIFYNICWWNKKRRGKARNYTLGQKILKSSGQKTSYTNKVISRIFFTIYFSWHLPIVYICIV